MISVLAFAWAAIVIGASSETATIFAVHGPSSVAMTAAGIAAGIGTAAIGP
jgi:hypothetical protein